MPVASCSTTVFQPATIKLEHRVLLRLVPPTAHQAQSVLLLTPELDFHGAHGVHQRARNASFYARVVTRPTWIASVRVIQLSSQSPPPRQSIRLESVAREPSTAFPSRREDTREREDRARNRKDARAQQREGESPLQRTKRKR
eukprot:2389714-Amphidinium_carterae.3